MPVAYKIITTASFLLLFGSFVSAQPVVGIKGQINPYRYTIKKSNVVSKNAVVSAHPLASQVGIAMMKKGGNAFDAAIATQMALAVVYPVAGNLGGGGFLVARTQTGKLLTLDYREMAPAAAHRDMYIDSAGNAQTEWSQNGHLASGVPGSVAGMYATFKYAKLPWKTLVQPAVDLAEKGYCITEAEADGLNAYTDEFIKYNTITPVFVKTGGWKTGDTLVQKDLAETLKRIRDQGPKGFYEGKTAELVVAEMKRAKGIITLADMAAYVVKERPPIVFPYKKDYTIIAMPPPSSGGPLLTQMLNMLENRNVKKLGFQSASYVQLITEAERRAYADRAEHLGDADFYPVPLKTLTSKAYARQRMSNYQPGVAGKSSDIKAGVIKKESEETTHFSIIDAAGNMISVTTTLNGGYGSKTVVGGAGFLLNNEMDDFSIKPGVANMYGALGGEANAIVPGKRMLSSMTPTLVLKNNRPYIICGTPGGTTIITSVLQTILNIIEFDMSAADAVNKPKFHHQWLPDVIFVEKDFNPAVVEQLKTIGYTITPRNTIGRTEVIKVIGKNKIEIAADKRGDDSAEGY
jgi:gamma-glutamyltranspeptidase / glutathione hydrolase